MHMHPTMLNGPVPHSVDWIGIPQCKIDLHPTVLYGHASHRVTWTCIPQCCMDMHPTVLHGHAPHSVAWTCIPQCASDETLGCYSQCTIIRKLHPQGFCAAHNAITLQCHLGVYVCLSVRSSTLRL